MFRNRIYGARDEIEQRETLLLCPIFESHEDMAQCVCLMHGGCWLGTYPMKEFCHYKDKFNHLAMLASDESQKVSQDIFLNTDSS